MIRMTRQELGIAIVLAIVALLLFAAARSGRKNPMDAKIANLERRLAELERMPQPGEDPKDAHIRDLKQRVAALEGRKGL